MSYRETLIKQIIEQVKKEAAWGLYVTLEDLLWDVDRGLLESIVEDNVQNSENA